MPPRARVSKAQPAKKAAPAKRATPAKKAAPAKIETAEKPAAVRRGRPPVLKLNKSGKVHQGIFDRKDNVVYTNVMLEPSRERRYYDGTIEGFENFLAWLNKKNGKMAGEDRFVAVEVIGANTDQRKDAGINKLYSQYLEENEDVRIASAMQLMLDRHSIAVYRDREKNKWVFQNGFVGGGNGGSHIDFLVETANLTPRRAYEVFRAWCIEELGEHIINNFDFVDDEWLDRYEKRRAEVKAHAEANGAK